ncbi:MAG: FecR domain-containing protein [Alphaproteobacteria bacterium]
MINQVTKILIAFFALLVFSGAAMAEAWVIVRSSGDIWIGSRSIQPVALGADTELAGGTVLVTGKRGRVMLARGEQTMVVGPDAHITLPGSTSDNATVLQRAGTILFDVDKRNVKHFSVETPFLAAVVKGTKFEVSVNPGDAVMNVREGTVELRDLYTGEFVDLRAKQGGAVKGNGPLTLSGLNVSRDDIRQGSPTNPLVEPLPLSEMQQIQNRASGRIEMASVSLLDQSTFGGATLISRGAADAELRRSGSPDDDEGERIVALGGSGSGGAGKGDDRGGEEFVTAANADDELTMAAGDVSDEVLASFESAGGALLDASIESFEFDRGADPSLSTLHIVLGIGSITLLVLGVAFVRSRFS